MELFKGEAASQQALRFAGMMCPKTLRIGNLPHGGSYMIQEFLNFDPDVLQVLPLSLLALLVQKYELVAAT